jgi:hypothetical protein
LGSSEIVLGGVTKLKRKGDGRRGKTDDPGEVFLRERELKKKKFVN